MLEVLREKKINNHGWNLLEDRISEHIGEYSQKIGVGTDEFDRLVGLQILHDTEDTVKDIVVWDVRTGIKVGNKV